MKALQLDAEEGLKRPTLNWVELPIPTPTHAEVLIRVLTCGVCGSDVHCAETNGDGRIRFSGPLVPPVILGHEVAGEVVAVAPGVTSIRQGDLVCCESILGCGVCFECRSGSPNQCVHVRLLGLSSPGAFADYLTVPERHVWRLDELLEATCDVQRTCELGCLVEPVACSYNGIFGTGASLMPGEHVVIYGAGPIGLGAVAITRLCGAATVTVFEPQQERRELAARMGADYTFDPNDTPGSIRERVLEITKGRGADLQIECAGAIQALMSDIEECFAQAGRLLYLGRTGQRARMTLDRFVSGAYRLFGSRGHVGRGCFPRIITLMARGRLNAAEMITGRFPMSEAIAAIRRAAQLRDGKVIVVAHGRGPMSERA